jgi:hypothetical protein
MKSLRLIFLPGLLLACAAILSAAAVEPALTRLEVFYFHRTLRCQSCLNMEAFTAEAAQCFSAEQDTGRLHFRAINLDDENDRPFEQDYALEFSSVVLSRRVNGQEVAWTNLPSVWELVGDKQNFIAYVETEIAKQLAQLPKE